MFARCQILSASLHVRLGVSKRDDSVRQDVGRHQRRAQMTGTGCEAGQKAEMGSFHGQFAVKSYARTR